MFILLTYIANKQRHTSMIRGAKIFKNQEVSSKFYATEKWHEARYTLKIDFCKGLTLKNQVAISNWR